MNETVNSFLKMYEKGQLDDIHDREAPRISKFQELDLEQPIFTSKNSNR